MLAGIAEGGHARAFSPEGNVALKPGGETIRRSRGLGSVPSGWNVSWVGLGFFQVCTQSLEKTFG